MIYHPHAVSRRSSAIPAAVLAFVSSACLCAAWAATPAASTAPVATIVPSGETSTETPSAKAQRICLKTEAEFARSHDLPKAWHGFLAANHADPNYAPAWFNLAVLLESQNKWQRAQDYFYRYLALAPKGPDAPRAHEQADLLKKYISGEMTPGDMRRADYDAAIQRARALLAAGFYREAIADAGQAQAIDSSRWEAYAVVSLCMARQHKIAEAGKMSDRALELAPADKRGQILEALSQTTTGGAN
jgi:tetratricopeptide (TPR) repeat protein